MPLVTTTRTGLVDQVIAQMRELVTSGEWPLGQRIPPEAELVNALGVGRNTVREAVRALAHAGLLEVRQGDGTFVRATSELSGAVRRLCDSELRQVLEVRRALEVESARLAATARTETDVDELREILDAREAAIHERDRERMIEHDSLFHLRLVGASHNPALVELYQGISEAVRSSIASTVDSDTPPEQAVSHTDLLNAVRDGDPATAAAEAGGFLEELLTQIGRNDEADPVH
ncbi:DNA-binding FadR family transcriptional regulator [Saccharopolyspora lacisalsi]|uniref:DNA-binding FadR family transcriptional regulator n=1 Tax=Halosaccharopolyspora lacisalsi TaxID=1000566 RepID=A0A839DQE8_9PSEU|nr:FadR/GntR family transcriptional regulator [Halosaccharopolyspora lacisalsi]MBA8823293.1 DNA-binding FadR family transcriptional regulator [Halosaccharopolyspora lacisalsi]